MKYANIKLDRGCISSFCCGVNTDRVINIGDHVQLWAIECLYETMGIPKDQIVDIEYYDLMDYNGEYVILPINLILFNPYFGERLLVFSPKIIPIFLGISYDNLYPHKEELNYFKKYQPIGCRDEYTLNLFRSFGVSAYLGGCLSATLSKRAQKISGNKVYFVDVPESLLEYIPETLKIKGDFVTQQYYGKFGEGINNTSIKDYTRKQFKIYSENAELIVTSRLHCVSPCMAMGIPVIFTPERHTHSYSWIEKIIPVFTREDFHLINWSPAAVEYEEIKQKMIQLAVNRIKEAYSNYQDMLSISSYFENRDKKQFEHSQLTYLIRHGKKYWEKYNHIKYAIWGVTMVSEAVIEYMEREFPESQLVAVFDDYRDFVYKGHQTIKTDKIKEYEDCCIIATGDSSSIAAKELFTETGRALSRYCLCFQSGYKIESQVKNC